MNKKGFTLIELLVVVVIIGVLSAIAIPAYMKAAEKSKAVEAIQTLSNIAKAEHDYFYAQSRYTDDFGKLAIEVFPNAHGDTHETQFFSYTLEEDAATADRDIGADSYTLYRVYDDPITYCQPEGNKYCKALDLPAGSRGSSVGNWQSCPNNEYPCTQACTRNITVGYTCTGTYNEDGSFEENVCDNRGFCVTTKFNKDQKTIEKNYCIYMGKKYCQTEVKNTYDMEGNLLSYKTCATSINGRCQSYGKGRVYTYDSNGNITSSASCTSWNNDGTCATRSSGTVYTYDSDDNVISSVPCQSWNDSDGTCIAYGYGFVYEYDSNGNRIKEIGCNNWNNNGVCEGTDMNGYRGYTYDGQGNLTSERECFDGFCYDSIIYTYDSNNNRTSESGCWDWNSNGDCKELITTTKWNYDSQGNKISQIDCYDGDCGFGGNVYDYIYDPNGYKQVESFCETFNNDGTCASDIYPSHINIYTYDLNGNVIKQQTCSTEDGETCKSYYNAGYFYVYDEDGNETSYRYCYGMNEEGNNCSNGGSNYFRGPDGKYYLI